MSLGEETAAEARERRVTALFTWATNTGESYPGFVRAIRQGRGADWWVDTALSIGAFHERAFAPEIEPGPNAAEVLVLAARLEDHYRVHVAEIDAEKENADAVKP